MDSIIVVHGGAGEWTAKTDQDMKQILVVCEEAARLGYKELSSGGAALDAVEASVRILESSPLFDAGRGSFPNSIGEIELDALIVDGQTLNLGAVASVKNVLHPVSLARKILSDSEHNFLVAQGAEFFAESIGFPRCQLSDLLVDSGLDESINLSSLETRLSNKHAEKSQGDTVGAVAIDQHGNLAAATSTGGTRSKHPGRVGDSPLIGSGAFADNYSAAVSATGHGEALMKVLISKCAADYSEAGFSAQEAAEKAIMVLERRVSGTGGLIIVDRIGNVGIAKNTKAMPYSIARSGKKIISAY